MLKNVLLMLFILIFGIGARVALPGNDGESSVIGLRYPKSYDAKTYQSITENVRNVRYRVRLSFPSRAVLDFYDDRLKHMGWVPFIQPAYRNREWGHFIDGTVQGTPLVHQLLATWMNKDKSRMILLALTYYSTKYNIKEKYSAKEPDNDIQDVRLQIMPFMLLPAKVDK